MAWLDATTGLRASELLALRWQDIDFDSGVMHVQRGIVYSVVGVTKTDASKSRVPLAASVIDHCRSGGGRLPTLLLQIGSSRARG
jgi:integrase